MALCTAGHRCLGLLDLMNHPSIGTMSGTVAGLRYGPVPWLLRGPGSRGYVCWLDTASGPGSCEQTSWVCVWPRVAWVTREHGRTHSCWPCSHSSPIPHSACVRSWDDMRLGLGLGLGISGWPRYTLAQARYLACPSLGTPGLVLSIAMAQYAWARYAWARNWAGGSVYSALLSTSWRVRLREVERPNAIAGGIDIGAGLSAAPLGGGVGLGDGDSQPGRAGGFGSVRYRGGDGVL